ncbi:hypothetical protein AB6A40_008243 [Gnathostoma spinigerum]|uniref:Frizzled-4 n=1 Tax=Gnathostoma spinigerum TaxID=75299 RepID=A0ABD6ETN1_9BILA
MCTDKVPIAIGPCRPLCERVRAKCEPVIREFGFPWPVSMNCSKFPLENNDDSMCMKGPMNEEPNDISAKHEEFDMNSFPMEPQVTRTKCTDPTTIYMNRTALCVPLCHSNHGFTKSDLEMAHSLLFVMSLLCVVLTSVCFVTFCFRRQCLMALPETSLFFCSICFAVSAVVYLFSLLYKDQISCMRYTTRLIFVSSGVQHIPCTTVAIILYYCGTTGRLWWFILCCSWNKLFTRQQHTAGKQLLRTHVLAWTVPLGAVMLALMAQSVHADSLSGICLVGSDSRMMEAIFVTLREFIMLLCCLVPLFFGCLALVGSASVNEHSMVSSGILGGLYPITATVILLSSLQHLFSPTITVWNTIRAVRLLADPTLGIVSSAGCLFQIIYNILKTNRSPHVDKHGYQPALPQLPHPIHMPNAEFVNTYSATANADQRPLC